MARPSAVEIVGRSVLTIRTSLGITQKELGRRAEVSQGMVSAIENARLDDLTFSRAESLLGAMGARLAITVDAPFLGDRGRQREPAHARCSAYVAAMLRRAGWEVATEVEIGGDRSRGWIDVLAFDPVTGSLLVIEIKTEIHDIGAIERSLGWYEREAMIAARRLGWRVRRSTGCLLLLATTANDDRIRSNRISIQVGFPNRARDLSALVERRGDLTTGGRAVAMIDPLSRRVAWVRPLTLDGRRSAAPYLDYAAFMRAADRRSHRRKSD